MGRRKTDAVPASEGRNRKPRGSVMKRRTLDASKLKDRLSSIKYSDLQKLAKVADLKANGKYETLARSLAHFYAEEATEEETTAAFAGMDASLVSFLEHEERLEDEAAAEEDNSRTPKTPKSVKRLSVSTPYSPSNRTLNITFTPSSAEKSGWMGKSPATPKDTPAKTPAKRKSSTSRFVKFTMDTGAVSDDESPEPQRRRSARLSAQPQEETDEEIKARIMASIEAKLAARQASGETLKTPVSAPPIKSPLTSATRLKSAKKGASTKSPSERFAEKHAQLEEEMETIDEFLKRRQQAHDNLTSAASERTKKLATPRQTAAERQAGGVKGPTISKGIRGGRSYAMVAAGVKKTPAPKDRFQPSVFHVADADFAFSSPAKALRQPLKARTPASSVKKATIPKPPLLSAQKSGTSPMKKMATPMKKVPGSLKKSPLPKFSFTADFGPKAADAFHFSPTKADAEGAVPVEKNYDAFRSTTEFGAKTVRTPTGLTPISRIRQTPGKTPGKKTPLLPRPILVSPPSDDVPEFGATPPSAKRGQPPPNQPSTKRVKLAKPATENAKAAKSSEAENTAPRPTRAAKASAAAATSRLFQPTLAWKNAHAGRPPVPGKVAKPVPAVKTPIGAKSPAYTKRGPLQPFVDTRDMPDEKASRVARMAAARAAANAASKANAAAKALATRRLGRTTAAELGRAKKRDDAFNQRRGL